MAVADTAKLIVDLSLKGNFVRQMGAATKALGKLDQTESRAFRAGQQIGTGIRNAAKLTAVGVGILVSQVALGLDSLIKLEKATAQTEAVIKSTGKAAGQSSDDIRTLAEKYEALNATIGDETIQAGENLLLTFTSIRKDAFEPSLKAALDLSVAMGTDLDTAIRTVGKALSEPGKAMARLRRQGIILTKSEEKQIEAHLENNDVLGAQTVILGALDKRYGGSFLAGGGTTAGKVAKFTDSIEDLQRALATALLPAIGNVADGLTEFLQNPAVIKGAEDLGRDIGKLFSKDNIKTGIDALRGAFQFAKEAAPVVASAARVMGSVVGTAVKLFTSLPPEIQNLAVAGLAVNKLTGGLVTNIAGGLISSVLKQLVSGVVNVQGGVVNVVGGGGVGASAAAGAAKGGLSGIAKVALVAEAIGLALLVNEVRNGIADQSTKISQGLKETQSAFLRGNPDEAAIRSALAGVNQGISDLQSNPLHTLVQGEALTNLQLMRADLQAKLSDTTSVLNRAKESQDQHLSTIGRSLLDQKIVQSAQSRTLGEAKQAAAAQAAQVQGAVRTTGAAAAGSIVGAIRANRPITNVNVNVSATHVTKSVTIQSRYGPGNGSSGQNLHAPGTGPLP